MLVKGGPGGRCDTAFIVPMCHCYVDTVECRYDAAQFFMILHMALWWQWKVDQTLYSQQTSGQPRASYVGFFVRIMGKIDCVIMTPHCIIFSLLTCRWLRQSSRPWSDGSWQGRARGCSNTAVMRLCCTTPFLKGEYCRQTSWWDTLLGNIYVVSGCWWPGDGRNQGISSHVIDIALEAGIKLWEGLLDNSPLHHVHSWYQGCWWPGSARS